MATVSSTVVSETARERETFKYDALAISTARLNGPQPPKPIPSSFLSSTPDPGLTAFAQLGLYRLNAARSLISLFDRSYQHIVAEALRPPPLGPNGQPPPSQLEPVWFNGLCFERATSVCEHVVTGEAANQSVPGTACGLTAEDMPVSVIKHLDVDPRFCHIKDPGRQFYAGVPIRSPTGINIGVYCVFDDKPRLQGLSADEVQFIRDISRVVMDYLESKRGHEWYRREQRMVRGLGSFVEGQATLWSWAEGTSGNAASFRDLPGMSEGSLNKKLQPTATARQQQQEEGHHPVASGIENRQPASQAGHHHGEASGIARTIPQSSLATAPATAKTPPATPVISHVSSTDLLCGNVERVFSKAANVIRESVEVEGVLFLDASIRSYGGLVGNVSAELPTMAEAMRSASESSGSDESARSQIRGSPTSGGSMCGVLGFSTSHSSSIGGDAVPNEFTGCKERFLQWLLQRYPEGQIFNFEADGAVSDQSTSSEGDEISASPNSANSKSLKKLVHPKKRLNAAARIIKLFPGARSVALVPVWDAQTGRWFAGGFVWTRTPTRIFSTENELSYLRVFGLTSMAEVARLKTRAADKAKTDILGSISHELRSPLHGLVGAVELLGHTILDAFQESVLRIIETSGRTLLDTIDHLLDFIKINNVTRSLKAGRRSSSVGPHQSPNSPAAALPTLELPIQLDLLVEEVVESVLAGSSYLTSTETYLPTSETSAQNRRPAKLSRSITNDRLDARLFSTRGDVQILLDIDHPASWSFRTHPGAFRRIVMNLFGNSLKFTKSGFIRVSLRQETQPKRKSIASTARVVLTVSDSGKGIGEDYLRDRLFMPFSQEDQFASGTGLGLSLVRQITATLGGTIDVSSTVGRGTMITVALPLPHAVEGTTDDEEVNFRQSIEVLAGQRVVLRGFEHETRVQEGFRSDDAKQKSQLRLMKGICQDLLRMEVVPELLAGEPVSPDFAICLVDNEFAGVSAETGKQVATYPHIFICRDLASAHRFTVANQDRPHMAYEVWLQPIGPRKIARALLAGRLRWQAAQNSESKPTVEPQHSTEKTISLQADRLSRSELGLAELTTGVAQVKQLAIATEADLSQPTNSNEPPPPPQHSLLPQHAAVLATQEGAADVGATATAPQRSILIVDDNSINLKISAAFMRKLRQEYTMAVNGLEALELYTSNPGKYSCVLTDISMPVMDGLESTRRMREFEHARGHKPVVVIAVSGLGTSAVRQEAFASGVDLLLTRPLAMRELEEALVSKGLQLKGSRDR